jgi:5,5'-dehydrodivanillate O-demethylase
LTGKAAAAYRRRREQAGELPAGELNDVAEEVLAGKRRIQNSPADFSTYKLFLVEDYATQVGQGAVADREHEHLGRIDAGMILVRKVWQRELRALAEGRPLTDWYEPGGVAEMHQVEQPV